MSDTVKLCTAFAWTCPGCESRNYLEGVAWEMTDEDREEMKEELGLIGGEFVLQPKTVKCKQCQKRYEVESPEDEQ